jgi:hypothetical protein
LLSLPLIKSAFDYIISITVSASLDSIAAIAKCRCCAVFAAPGRIPGRLAYEMHEQHQQLAAKHLWLPKQASGFPRFVSSANERDA